MFKVNSLLNSIELRKKKHRLWPNGILNIERKGFIVGDTSIVQKKMIICRYLKPIDICISQMCENIDWDCSPIAFRLFLQT